MLFSKNNTVYTVEENVATFSFCLPKSRLFIFKSYFHELEIPRDLLYTHFQLVYIKIFDVKLPKEHFHTTNNTDNSY